MCHTNRLSNLQPNLQLSLCHTNRFTNLQLSPTTQETGTATGTATAIAIPAIPTNPPKAKSLPFTLTCIEGKNAIIGLKSASNSNTTNTSITNNTSNTSNSINTNNSSGSLGRMMNQAHIPVMLHDRIACPALN